MSSRMRVSSFLLLVAMFVCSVAGAQQPAASAAAVASAAPSDLELLKDRVRDLELSQASAEKAVERSQAQLTNFQVIVGLMAAVLTVLFFGGQFFAQKRDQTFANEQSEKYHRLLEGFDERNKGFRDASQASVAQVTTLIGSLDALFKLSREAETLKQDFEEERKKRLEAAEREKAAAHAGARDLNGEALDICRSLNRENYKVGYHKARIRNLSAKLERWPNPAQLNGNAKLILGLDNVVRDVFDEALKSFEAASRMSMAHADSQEGVDIDLLYPGVERREIASNARIQANIDLFHSAMVHYNLGEHAKAAALFQEAVKYAPRDVQSMGYVPESLFLSREQSFDQVVDAFKKAEAAITETEESPTWRVKKTGHLSLLQVKWGNCYYPNGLHAEYRATNLRLAEEHYKKALALDPNSYLAKFSYAQALLLKSQRDLPFDDRTNARLEAHRLLQEVFEVVKVRVGEITEAKIEMTLNYVLAICAKEGNIAGVDWTSYVRDIYKLGGKLPPVKGFRIFSPLSKSDLVYADLKRELQEFERREPAASTRKVA